MQAYISLLWLLRSTKVYNNKDVSSFLFLSIIFSAFINQVLCVRLYMVINSQNVLVGIRSAVKPVINFKVVSSFVYPWPLIL